MRVRYQIAHIIIKTGFEKATSKAFRLSLVESNFVTASEKNKKNEEFLLLSAMTFRSGPSFSPVKRILVHSF